MANFDENYWREQLDYLYNNGYPDDQRNIAMLNHNIVKTPDGRIDKAGTQYAVHTKLYEAFQRGEDVGQDMSQAGGSGGGGGGGGYGGGGGAAVSATTSSSRPAFVDPALGNVPTMRQQMATWSLKTIRFERKPLGFGALTLDDKLLVMDVTAGSIAQQKGVKSQWHIVEINGKNDVSWMKKHLKKSNGPFEITFTYPGGAGRPAEMARAKSSPNIARPQNVKFVDPALGNVTSVSQQMHNWTARELTFPTKPLGFGVVILKTFLVVQDVRPDSLAASLGVKLQWHVTKVNGETSVQAMMHMLHRGHPPFSIEFKYRGPGSGASSTSIPQPGAASTSSDAPPPPGLPSAIQPGASSNKMAYEDGIQRAHTDPPGAIENSRVMPSAFQVDRKKNKNRGGGGGGGGGRGPPPSAAAAMAASQQPGGANALPFRRESNVAESQTQRCAECQKYAAGRPDEFGTFYCNSCWANYNSQLTDVVNSPIQPPGVSAPSSTAPAVPAPSMPAVKKGWGKSRSMKNVSSPPSSAMPSPQKKWGAPSSNAPSLPPSSSGGRGPPPSAAAAQKAISQQSSASSRFGPPPGPPGAASGGPPARSGGPPPFRGPPSNKNVSSPPSRPAVPRSFGGGNKRIGSPPSSGSAIPGPPNMTPPPMQMQKQASPKNLFGPPPSKSPPNVSSMRGAPPSVPGGNRNMPSVPSYGPRGHAPGPPGSAAPGPPGGNPPPPPFGGGGGGGGPPPPAPGATSPARGGGGGGRKKGWGFGGFGNRGANNHQQRNNNPNLPQVDKSRANLLNSIQKTKKKKLNHVETREPASPLEMQRGGGGRPPPSGGGGGLLGLDNAIANRRRMIMGSVASSQGDDDEDDEWR